MQNETRAWEVGHAAEGMEGQTVQDYLYFEGMFNPVLRFAFTNVLDEDFSSKWNGNTNTVKAHETVKLPHHLAVKFTKEIVDILMQRDNKGMMIGVPDQRKPYENKVLALLPPETGMQLEVIKNEFLEQLQHDTSLKEGVVDQPLDDLTLNFDDLKPKNFGEAKKAVKSKKQ